MANTNFQIFDESLTDIDTDAEYLAETQRLNGVTPGLASPKMHNKLYRQCSVMAYAIANVIKDRGYNANDNDPAALINAIQRTFAYSVNGNVPGAGGAVTMSTPLDAWPVGSIFITASNSNPATLLGGGTWVKIQGKYLLAASSTYTLGNSYGSMTKTIGVANLPSHTHGFTTGSAGAHTHTISGTAANNGAHTHTLSATAANAGAHTHTGTAASNGSHSHTGTTNSNGAHTHGVSGSTGAAGSHGHTRGTMNITGTFSGVGQQYNASVGGATLSGAIFRINTVNNPSQGVLINNGGERDDYFGFDASKSWTGSTSMVSNHDHSVSLTSASNGAHTHTFTTGIAGAHTHTITADSNGTHTHTLSGSAVSNGNHTHTVSGTAAGNGAHTHTGTTNATGSGTALNIMPESLAVNVWRRTA